MVTRKGCGWDCVVLVIRIWVDYDVGLGRNDLRVAEVGGRVIGVKILPLHTLLAGPSGSLLGPILIIRTVNILRFIQYFILVKNQVDRISESMCSENCLLNSLKK